MTNLAHFPAKIGWAGNQLMGRALGPPSITGTFWGLCKLLRILNDFDCGQIKRALVPGLFVVSINLNIIVLQ